MKRIIAEWALLFLLCCCTSACAQEDLLANLDVVNRRISGTLDACFGAGGKHCAGEAPKNAAGEGRFRHRGA